MNQLLANAQLQEQNNSASSAAAQQQMAYQEMEKGLAEEQLDVDGIIYSLYNTLCGNRITFDDDGRKIWEKNSDTSLRILSDNGIQRTMQTIMAYVNKLKMLSNHNNEEILKAMYDFTTELNDNFLMRYEDIFYSPTFDECKKILEDKMKEEVKIKKFSAKLINKSIDEKEIERKIFEEMDSRMHYEIKKIRDQERKKRVKEYGMLILLIEHQVLDTYRRSEGGKERSTLRQHANFSEIRAVGEPQKQQGAFSWLKR